MLYPWDEDYVEPVVAAEQLKQAEKMLQIALERSGGDMNMKMVDVLSDDWDGGDS